MTRIIVIGDCFWYKIKKIYILHVVNACYWINQSLLWQLQSMTTLVFNEESGTLPLMVCIWPHNESQAEFITTTQTLWRRLTGVIRKENLVSTHVIAPWVRMASSIQQRMIKPMRKNTFLILENPALCNYPEQQTWPSQATTPSRSLWSGGVGQGQARRCKGGRKGQGQGGKQRASSGAQWILTLQ